MWHGQVCIFPGCPASRAEAEAQERQARWQQAPRLTMGEHKMVECPFCATPIRDIPESIQTHDRDHVLREGAGRRFPLGLIG